MTLLLAAYMAAFTASTVKVISNEHRKEVFGKDALEAKQLEIITRTNNNIRKQLEEIRKRQD